MAFLMRGALVEYASDFLGPLPNIIIFQFNPEQIARTISIPDNSTTGTARRGRTREHDQTQAPASESFTLTAHFSAADDLGRIGQISSDARQKAKDIAAQPSAGIAHAFGIGPQLAALEKMVYPTNIFGGLLGGAIDTVGELVTAARMDPRRRIPRERVPKILFIWGPSRVLPVEIKSLSITEQKYDFLLNPVQAEVQIGLEVKTYPRNARDKLGKGALVYTTVVKEAQAALNMLKVAEQAVDIVTF
jgi:hypothetical protein